MKTDKIVQDILNGKIDTKCCPEVDEVFERYKRGEANIEELRQVILNKWNEAVRGK